MKWLLGFAAVCVALWLWVSSWVGMPAFTPLSLAERDQLYAAIRQHRPRPFEVPMVLTWWQAGRPALRIEARNLDDALRQFAAPPAGRLEIDLLRAEAPLPTRIMDRWPLVFSFSAVPGLDALELEADGRRALLLPDDLQRADALASHAPFPQLDLEVGLDVGRVLQLALDRLGLDSESFEKRPHRWRRLRVERFVENAAGDSLLPVVRGHSLSTSSVSSNLLSFSSLSISSLSDGAVKAGEYLVRHLGPDGRFDYLFDPLTARSEREGYSLPRHAGATSFLAQLSARDARLTEPTLRALGFLIARSRPPRGSVGEGSEHDLGGSALSLIAAAEYQKASGDRRFQPFLLQLGELLLWLQQADGDFRHLYRPDEDLADEHFRAPYYSGEAALALARLATLEGIPDSSRFAAAADRALDYLTGKQYDFFVGQFMFAEDHWTCMAADALWDKLTPARQRRYAGFCVEFASFLRRMQYTDGDFAGGYGIGPILPAHDTPTGSRSECAISVWRMARRMGWPSDALSDQILSSMQFLLARQLSDDQLWLSVDPGQARGGIPQSDVKPTVRIDAVQHAGLALLRAAEVLSVLH